MFADGSLGVRHIWWLLQCSHLMVPLCLVVCPVGARLTAVCGAALCPVVLLLALDPPLPPPHRAQIVEGGGWCKGLSLRAPHSDAARRKRDARRGIWDVMWVVG